MEKSTDRSDRPLHESGKWFSGAFGVTAGVLRLLPHPPNFAPVGALGLFAGARLGWWQAIAVPLAVMAISDVALNALFGYAPFNRFVYACIILNVFLGRLLLRKTSSPGRVFGVSLLAGAQFFVVSNFGVWAAWSMYPHTLAGLAQCYAAAIPFFRFTLLGDLAFVGLMFGLHAFVTSRQRAPQEVPVRLLTAAE